MLNTLITNLQLFGVGLSFALLGPCALFCAPVLVAYVARLDISFNKKMLDVIILLCGRLLAYVILGGIAGISASLLNHYTAGRFAISLNYAGGLTAILLGLYILLVRHKAECGARQSNIQTLCSAGSFGLGFAIGILPCAPLIALLAEIVIISKGVLDGIVYALSFGLGTVCGALIIAVILAGLIRRLPPWLVTSRPINIIVRILCSSLLVAFGIRMFLK